MDAQLETQIRQLLQTGRKIQAIKLLRKSTGLGLSEAKAAVEALENSSSVKPRASMSDSEIEAKIGELVRQNKVIEAIKMVREATGWGLKESREYVDIFVLEHQQTLPEGQRKNPYMPQISLTTVLGVVAMVLVVLIFWLSKKP